MFWTLGLAHVVADYPLQTDGLVRVKRHWAGLLLHVVIHFLMMLLLSGRHSLIIWPQLVVLTAAHYAIDAFKNFESRRWPRIVVRPYVLDQLLHIVSIALVAAWIQSAHGVYRDQAWMVYAIAYLGVTHVWFITERIVARREPAYEQAVDAYRWPRQAVRAGALTLFLLVGHLLPPSQLWAVVPLLLAPIAAPYRTSFRRRMLMLDLGGPLLTAIIVLLINATSPSSPIVPV